MKHGSHLVPRGVCRALHFNSIFLFFPQGIFSIILVLFRSYFDTLFIDLDCISCRFGLQFGTLLAGLGFFPSVLAPGALPERSWKPSTTPAKFLMICCWIFTSNSVHMSYNLKTCTVSRSLILLPCPCFCAAQRSALQLLRSAVFQNNMFWVS